MFNAATIVLTDDMDNAQLNEALSQEASVILDLRMKPVTAFVPDIVARFRLHNKLQATPAVTQGKPKEISI